MAPKTRFTYSAALTSIAQVYTNEKFIADDALPRVPAPGILYSYTLFNKGDAFTIPDTKVGRKSLVNEIDWSATTVEASVEDYGLDDVIPYKDQLIAEQNGTGDIDPEQESTELLTDLVALDREKRVATLLFDPNTYPSANKVTLSGTSQWSDYTNSDPIAAILAAFDTMLVRPNTGVIGRAVFTKLIQHPKVVAAVYPNGGNAATGGVAAIQALANILELDNLYIGEGWYNSAKPGQTVTMTRLWGKHASFYNLSPLFRSTESKSITFGWTAQWGDKVAGTIDEPKVGLRGGTRIRVGESVKETIAASDLGYLFQNAVA